MWYLIKSSLAGKYSIRYYPSIDEGHSVLYVSSTSVWVSDINEFHSLKGPLSYYIGPRLKEFYSHTDYLIQPLPKIPRDIPSIDTIKFFYPELFL